MAEPLKASTRIGLLINQTEAWQNEHRRMGRDVEAAACAVRLAALKDALRMAKAAEAGR